MSKRINIETNTKNNQQPLYKLHGWTRYIKWMNEKWYKLQLKLIKSNR